MNLHEYLKLKKAFGGGVTSWNDLTDKPFYETEEIFEKSVIAPASGESSGRVLDLEIAQAIFDDYTCATITFFDGTYELDGIKDTYSYKIVYGVKGKSSYDVSIGLTDGKLDGYVSWNRGGYNYAPQAEIAVHSVKREIKKLDKKYLPDDIVFTGVPNDDGWYDYTCNVDYETARTALTEGATARMILASGNEIKHLTLQSVQYNDWRVKLNFFDIRDTNAEYGIIDYNEDGSIGGGVE